MTPPVFSASPFLDNLLIDWSHRTTEVRRTQSSMIDTLQAERKSLDDAWQRQQIQVTQGWYALERFNEHLCRQWTERLKPLEQSGVRLAGLGERVTAVDRVVLAGLWLGRAGPLAGPLARGLRILGDRLAPMGEELDLRLVMWQETLEAKEKELQLLKEKDESKETPLLVSRARKQPELDFVDAQTAAEKEIGEQVRLARQKLHHAMDRLYKASNALEHHAATHPGLYDAHKNQLLDVLLEPRARLLELRETILSNALVFETCRRKLRWIQTTVRSIRCLEDVYKSPQPLWKKLLR